jgi:hypothetical protein
LKTYIVNQNKFHLFLFLFFILTSHVSVIAGHPQALNTWRLNLKRKTTTENDCIIPHAQNTTVLQPIVFAIGIPPSVNGIPPSAIGIPPSAIGII